MHVRFARARRHHVGQAGFSITEVLTATALGLITLAVAASFEQFQLGALRDQAVQLEVQSSAQTLLDLFSRELRRACGVSFAAPDRIRFQADLDGDGRIQGVEEDVEYLFDMDGGRVIRRSLSVQEVVISGFDLDGTALRYFGRDGRELLAGEAEGAAVGAIARVRVELVLARESVSPLRRVPLRAEMSSDIQLRGSFFVNEIATPSRVPPAR